MEFKQRFSRMFGSSFGSCRSREVSDVIEKPIFVSENPHSQSFSSVESPPLSLNQKARSFPSICRPSSQNPTNSAETSFITHVDLKPTRRDSRKKSLAPLLSVGLEGSIYPPASPVFPVNPFYKHGSCESRAKPNKLKKKKKKTHMKNKKQKTEAPFYALIPSSSSSGFDNGCGGAWFSSGGDEKKGEETETFFSSKSNTLSSDSSESRRKTDRARRNTQERRRSRARGNSEDSKMDLLPVEGEGKVNGSFAVVKRSSDPYMDFRTSMVEMIVEKQIFGAEDLEQLLQCFLSLNSAHHHRVIVQVFVEIWEALFCNWS